MSLARAWRRELFRASGAVLLVPATMVAALAVLALAGGFGLGTLGQLFTGPGVASGQPVAALSHAAGHHRAARPVTAVLAAATSPGVTLIAQVGIPVGGNGGLGGHGGGPTGGPGPGVGNGPGGYGGGGGGKPHHPKPPSNPTLADAVVKLGTSITSKIPGPVGPAATNALVTAGQVADKVLPPPPPIPKPSPASLVRPQSAPAPAPAPTAPPPPAPAGPKSAPARTGTSVLQSVHVP